LIALTRSQDGVNVEEHIRFISFYSIHFEIIRPMTGHRQKIISIRVHKLLMESFKINIEMLIEK
jgi:hypothetical protein